MPSNHLILCHPLLLLPSIFPSIRVFSNESAFSIRWPKYWSFSFNINLSNEHPGLISFRMDLLDRLAIQGILKSLPQHHNLKTSILQHSAGGFSGGSDGKASAASPSQGRWDPDSLRPALNLRGQATAWECSPGALQHRVGFCHTSTRISRRHTHGPFLLNLPPSSYAVPPL